MTQYFLLYFRIQVAHLSPSSGNSVARLSKSKLWFVQARITSKASVHFLQQPKDVHSQSTDPLMTISPKGRTDDMEFFNQVWHDYDPCFTQLALSHWFAKVK